MNVRIGVGSVTVEIEWDEADGATPELFEAMATRIGCSVSDSHDGVSMTLAPAATIKAVREALCDVESDARRDSGPSSAVMIPGPVFDAAMTALRMLRGEA